MNSQEIPSDSPAGDAPGGDFPGVRAAAEAVCRAKEELLKAQRLFEELRRQTTEKVGQVRKTTIGEAADAALNVVRRWPGASLAVAALAGLWLGRHLRK
jgi:ElaB/YqjD/DUF883 family membrane-anchored ribosome-binding protein